MNDTEIYNEAEYIPNGLPGGIFIYRADGDETIIYADQNVIDLFDCRDMGEFRTLTHNSFKGMVFEEDLEKVENGIQSQTMFGEKRHDYVRYRIKTKKGVIKYIEDSPMQPFCGITDASSRQAMTNRFFGFLESRCYENNRADLPYILKQAGLTSNNPYEWIHVCHGVTWEDFFWVRFDDEEIAWDDVRIR